jgi:hypothetical protein
MSLLAVIICVGEMCVGWSKARLSNFHSGCFVES